MKIESDTIIPVIAQRMAGRRAPLAAREQAQDIQCGRRLLYGSLSEDGACIEGYDFSCSGAVDWSGGFQARSLGLCLNLEGQGAIGHKTEVLRFEPRTAGFFL